MCESAFTWLAMFCSHLISLDSHKPCRIYVTSYISLVSDRPNSDRANSDRANSGRANSDRPNSDRANSDRPNSDRANSDRANSDRPNSDRPNSDRPKVTGLTTVQEVAGACRSTDREKETF
jgi:hypothetical protein